MTEGEWLNATKPNTLMGLLQGNGTTEQRRCRLFACACVRRAWQLLPTAACRTAVEVAEQFADGEESTECLGAALARVDFSRRRRGHLADAQAAMWYAAYDSRAASTLDSAYGGQWCVYDWALASRSASKAADAAAQKAGKDAQRAAKDVGQAMQTVLRAEQLAQADLLRCVFGNPLRAKPAIDPSWLAWNDCIIKRLAEGIYQESAFERMPVLADALEEVGCADQEILAHCRGPGPHARGCWVVDLLTRRG